jgi:hypothetical protein
MLVEPGPQRTQQQKIQTKGGPENVGKEEKGLEVMKRVN